MDEKIIIFRDGNNVLARHYKDCRTTGTMKEGKATCSPDDTFDFITGAKLAFERLTKEDKPLPKFKVGDKVKVKDTGDMYTSYLNWFEVITKKPEHLSKWRNNEYISRGTVCNVEAYGKHGSDDVMLYAIYSPEQQRLVIIAEGGIEPYAEPEEILLYCVKDYYAYRQLTKGKIYKFTSGQMTYDDGIKGAKYSSWDEYKIYNGDVADCLVPLVKRPAKVGEWIYISRNDVVPKFEGTIGKVERFKDGRPNIRHKTVWFDTHGDGTENTTISNGEYLVLDGYKPEPEKPKLYNSKLVCVKGGPFHTKGKTYKVVDGALSSDTIESFEKGFESIDDINNELCAQFIELVE